MNNLKINDFVKVTGFPVKNDNDIFIVTNKYEDGELCLHKVTMAGTISKCKYNIVFLKPKHFEDPTLSIEFLPNVESLKKAKKEVNNFLKGIESVEKVFSFVPSTKTKLEKGSYIKVVKSFGLMSSMYNIPVGTIYYCTGGIEGINYTLNMVGKRGETLSTYNASGFNKVLLSFNVKNIKELFEGEFISLFDRIEQTKGEIEKTNIPETPEVITPEVVEVEKDITEVQTTPDATEDPYKQEEIEDGYIYNMHFKAWEKTIEEIETELNRKGILFTNMGDKTGCYNLSFEQARIVKNISDTNGSICFIDSKTPITQKEQPEVQEEFIQASKRQLYALYLGTKIKTTDLVISKEKAGELISKSIKGENVTAELQAFINGNVEKTITETPVELTEVEEVQEEENKIMEAFDDILSKFDEIEVNNNTRIAPEDQIFCEETENEYNEFIKFSNDYLEYLSNNSLSNIFYNSEALIVEMDKAREYKKDLFISKVVNYFEDKYKVTLSSDPIQKKYNSISIKHDIIVDEIISQLEGYNFTDKAEKEIKDEFKNALRYDKIKIKNTKISIESFFQLDYFNVKYGTYEVGYGSDEKFYKLFKALSHFLYGSTENFFSDTYSTITRETNDNVFKTHDIHTKDMIKTLKVYKNGKIDLEFNTPDHMRKFAREYCGYTEQAAK